MLSSNRLLVAVVGTALAGSAFAQAQTAAPPAAKPLSTSLGMVVFPAKGQTPQKQSQDEGECYAWAKGQTGVDPLAPPPTAAPTAAAQPPRPAPADGSRFAALHVVPPQAQSSVRLRTATPATAQPLVPAGVVAGGRQSRQNQTSAAAATQQQATQQQTAAQGNKRTCSRKMPLP
jgi:hypothetical protein